MLLITTTQSVLTLSLVDGASCPVMGISFILLFMLSPVHPKGLSHSPSVTPALHSRTDDYSNSSLLKNYLEL